MANKKDILVKLLLLEEMEDDEILQLCIESDEERNNDVRDMYSRRRTEGFFNILINRHLIADDTKFREFFRLNISQFNFVLNLIREDIKCASCNKVLYPITPEEKLALTLRFMATGETFRSLAFTCRISESYISRIIQRVLKALNVRLMPVLLPPLSKDELKKKADDFWNKWQFPNCVGAVDGKHIRIAYPRRSGSLFNYKKHFSTVLLAFVDANYKFVFVDVGAYGKEGSSGIFEKSNIGKEIKSERILPPAGKLPNSDKVLPYVFIGDEAFRLDIHMMKPFQTAAACVDQRKAIYNYRLCHARRVSENAFGLLTQVFRIFYNPIALKTETVDNLIIAACCLHNLLLDASLEAETKPFYQLNTNEPRPSQNFIAFARRGGFANKEGFHVRDEFMDYFNSVEGAVEWQTDSTQS